MSYGFTEKYLNIIENGRCNTKETDRNRDGTRHSSQVALNKSGCWRGLGREEYQYQANIS